jgi:hypothetical protein
MISIRPPKRNEVSLGRAIGYEDSLRRYYYNAMKDIKTAYDAMKDIKTAYDAIITTL